MKYQRCYNFIVNERVFPLYFPTSFIKTDNTRDSQENVSLGKNLQFQRLHANDSAKVDQDFENTMIPPVPSNEDDSFFESHSKIYPKTHKKSLDHVNGATIQYRETNEMQESIDTPNHQKDLNFHQIRTNQAIESIETTEPTEPTGLTQLTEPTPPTPPTRTYNAVPSKNIPDAFINYQERKIKRDSRRKSASKSANAKQNASLLQNGTFAPKSKKKRADIGIEHFTIDPFDTNPFLGDHPLNEHTLENKLHSTEYVNTNEEKTKKIPSSSIKLREIKKPE